MYNPYVLTRPYQHLTFVALIGRYQIMSISHNISCKIWRQYTGIQNQWIPLQAIKNEVVAFQKVSWLFNEFSESRSHLFKF